MAKIELHYAYPSAPMGGRIGQYFTARERRHYYDTESGALADIARRKPGVTVEFHFGDASRAAGLRNGLLNLMGVETMTTQPVDTEAARELALYAVNDATIYHQKIQPIIKNLARKIKRGTYDAALAPKAWRYAADMAAVRYTCEFDANTVGPFGCFTPATRDLAAVEIAEHYAEELQEAT